MTKEQSKYWTEDAQRLPRLIELNAQGGLSRSAIAGILSTEFKVPVTRNVVGGKLDRIFAATMSALGDMVLSNGKTVRVRLKELVEREHTLTAGEVTLTLRGEGASGIEEAAVRFIAKQEQLVFKGGRQGVSTGPRVRKRMALNAAVVAKVEKDATPPSEAVEEEEPALLLEDGTRATVLTVNDRMCRWPIGDPCESDFHFCGRKPKLGSPYCEAHKRKAFQPRLGGSRY